MTTREQKAIARAELSIGKKLGVGGDAWSVSRPTGDGVGSAVSAAPVGVWTGSVVEEDPAALAQAAPGAAVGAKGWYAVGQAATVVATPPALDTTLRAGDVLTSQADSSIVFAVGAPDLVVGYVRYLVTRS